ncbi:MAG: class I tRNA ligase family protein [bacterium]|nr:class I tRNA ligase family protein [bacterium]
MPQYNHIKIEKKWQKRWEKEKYFEARETSKLPKYYPLVEFPYPSGEGLHVGHIKSYTAMDVVARKRRAEGYSVLYPIGWDAFGLPTENYALKTGVSPQKVTKKNTDNFRKQLKSLGFSFDWSREINTTDPKYYKWTQWIFLKLFEKGLAYKKKMPINWCIDCKTGLANEEVVDDACERCGGDVEIREKEQWMLKITEYADRLDKDLDTVDYLEKIKIQQRNWIGRSEGCEVEFPITQKSEKPNFLILHGWTGRADKNFLPWLKSELERIGFKAQTPQLPNTDNPTEEEQVSYILENCLIDENTIMVGHSLGAIVAMKSLIKHNKPVKGLVLIAAAMDPNANTEFRPFHSTFSWDFDFKKLKKLAPLRLVLSDIMEDQRIEYLQRLAKKLDAPIASTTAKDEHFTAEEEPFILNNLISSIKVFTTRPDTLFGATYLVLAPEHHIISNLKSQISNWDEVFQYTGIAAQKSAMERTALGKEKTGVELKGVKAINPANGEEIPVWIADYVLAHYGTGAIMAVPAHDERDFEFAKKYNIPIRHVIEPVYSQSIEPGKVVEGLPFDHRNAIIAVVEHWSEKKYLALKWKKVAWGTFITGGIEDGQTAEEAAKMEIREETGYLNPKLVADFGVLHGKFYHVPKKVNRFAHARALLFKLENNERQEVSAEEQNNHETRWLTKEELQNFLTPDSHFRALDILNGKEVYSGEGILTNSKQFDGITSEEAKEKITAYVGGKKKVTYKLRDWVFSRQRYWGEPIPIIHCEKCGMVPVPEKDLPVELPKVKKYEPTDIGESPLAAISKWVNVKCPQCKGKAKRETDTMPNWAGSSWYYLAYIMRGISNFEFPISKYEKVFKKWLPVDWYNGGMEHTTLHLLYSRFWHKFLFDIGAVPTSEPYAKRTSHGLILAENGEKMSKSKGNVVSPDTIVKIVGADSLRLYEMFMGPFSEAIAWNTENIAGARRFIERVYALAFRAEDQKSEGAILSLVHQTIKKVGDDIEAMKFNTAISQMMIFLNAFEKEKIIFKDIYKIFVRLLAPFAPHVAEEIWELLGEGHSIHKEPWPLYDEEKIIETVATIVVQVNGKVRGEFQISRDEEERVVKEKAQALDKIQRWVQYQTIKKIIYIPGKLVNIVTGATDIKNA